MCISHPPVSLAAQNRSVAPGAGVRAQSDCVLFHDRVDSGGNIPSDGKGACEAPCTKERTPSVGGR